jgi:hypothetical protein
MGFRTLFDVIPLNPRLVHGSHGLQANEAADGPIFIADGPASGQSALPMTAVNELLLQALGLGGV